MEAEGSRCIHIENSVPKFVPQIRELHNNRI